MTLLANRGKAFELEFAHRQDIRFKKNFYRNLSLGRWAAQEMGLTGAAAEAYIGEIGSLGILSGDENNIIHRIYTDLQGKGLALSEADVHIAMERSADIAEKLA
jgi:hypothetical protein